MKVSEKVWNIIKNKFNSKLIYSKKYLKAEKNKHKRRLSMFICTSNIDSLLILMKNIMMKNWRMIYIKKKFKKLLTNKKKYKKFFLTWDFTVLYV